jgi:hypothetical protein
LLLLIKFSGIENLVRVAIHSLPQRTNLFVLILVPLDGGALGNSIQLGLGILALELNYKTD